MTTILRSIPAMPPQQQLDRLRGEAIQLRSKVLQGAAPCVQDIQMCTTPQGGLQCTLVLKNFDESCAGGRQLNADLRRLGARHGQDWILLEMTFPDPQAGTAPAVRVVTPRCVPNTGHLGSDGRSCAQLLATTSVDYALKAAISGMVNGAPVAAAGGAAGTSTAAAMAGPLRVDLAREDPLEPYQVSTVAATPAAQSWQVPGHWWQRGILPSGNSTAGSKAVLVRLPQPGTLLSSPALAAERASVMAKLLQGYDDSRSGGTRPLVDRVVEILRVENSALHMAYTARKARDERRSSSRQGTPGATDAGEKWLFHGTTHQAVSTIVDQGFDPSKARSTCILGYGSYFAERSYTAMIYATPGYGGRSNSASAAPSSGTSGSYAVVPATTPPHPNHTQLVLAQVLLGKQGPGHNGITGAACAAAGYDTVNSPHSSDTMHVVFDADRIYPAYIIILKR